MSTKTMRTVRRVDKPRPLKTSDSFLKMQPVSSEVVGQTPEKSLITSDSILENLKCLHVSISNGNLNDSTFALIGHVCSQLKDAGRYLEQTTKDQLDKYFVTLRNASRDERVAMHIRMRLLEIIELRAMGWKSNDNIISYYEQKIMNAEQNTAFLMNNMGVPSPLMSSVSTSAIPTSIFQPPGLMTSASQVSLGPGEILKNSGKFIKPTKIPGKNFFKDEVLIRNSDSGKVMGIKGRRVHMIEELSDTIISFQRVSPGAKDRLVQITGPHEENISRAKVLIEDTIRRNASPVRDTPDLGSLGGLVTSGSCTSLNSTASEESLHNQPIPVLYQQAKNHMHQSHMILQQPQVPVQQKQEHHHHPAKKVPLAHSYSMGNNTLGDYSYTITVGTNSLRISGSQAELVMTSKLVLEEYFAGQAEISHNQSSSDVLPGSNSRTQHHRIQRQTTLDSENGSGSLSNGHIGNSSSEEETFKAEGSPPDKVLDLPLDPPQSQTGGYSLTSSKNASTQRLHGKTNAQSQVDPSGNLPKSSVTVVRQPLFPASKHDAFKRAESLDDPSTLAAKNRRATFGSSSSQKNSSSEERSFERQGSEERVSPYKRTDYCHVSNSYHFLLNCAAAQASKVFPEALKEVCPEVFDIIVNECPKEYFDPSAYRALTTIHKNLSSPRSSSSTGTEEVWEIGT